MSDRLQVATTKGLFTFERTAGRWGIARTAFLGSSVTMVLTDPRDGALHVAVGHGHFGVKMHRSLDGGKSFTELTAPAYPEKPAETDEKDMWGKPIPWTLQRVWALETGGASDPGGLWCGTIPGGLFRSTDRGESWALVRSLWDHPDRTKWFGGGADLPGIHSVCVHPRDPRHVVVGVSCGGVWVSRDGGDTWKVQADGMHAAYMPPEKARDPVIQDPHRVVMCEAAPAVLWAQHHNGVFRSTDGAASWQEVKTVQPSVFGFAVAVHPRDGETAWLVPAVKDECRIPVDGKVVVARTRDGGKSFEVLRQGLPQEHAYDLTYRHALEVDGSGDRLAFGSTTGSLWLSEDQGDRWQALSTHLPPIWAVRFEA